MTGTSPDGEVLMQLYPETGAGLYVMAVMCKPRRVVVSHVEAVQF